MTYIPSGTQYNEHEIGYDVVVNVLIRHLCTIQELFYDYDVIL